MSTGLSPEQRQRFEATARILAGEDPDVVAGELSLAPAAVRRDADDLISPEQLKSVLERMAGEHGLVGRAEFPFQLGVGAKSYRPDCVCFAERVAPETAVAIFEVEVGTSPKHRADGIAFANFVALSGPSPIRFFAIARGRNQLVTLNTVELFATRLGDRWRLDPVVISSFSPAVIRERVRAAFGA